MFMDFYRCEANIPKGTGFSGNSFSPPPRFQSSRAFRNWALLQEQPGYLHDCFDCCCDHLLLQFLVVVDGKHHHHLRSPHQGFQVKGFQPYIYIYIVWHMLNQCRTFATVRLEMTSESKLLQLKTHGKSPRFSVGWCARSKALKSTGHRVVRIYQSPIAHHYKIVSDAILLPFKDQLPFTLYQYSYVFFIYIYRHWICTTTSTAKLFDIQTLSAPNNHLESMRVHHYSTFALARVGWHWRSTTPAMNLS